MIIDLICGINIVFGLDITSLVSHHAKFGRNQTASTGISKTNSANEGQESDAG